MTLNTLGKRLIMQRPYWIGLVLLWGALTALSYLWNLRTVEAYAERIAIFRGRLVFEVIQASRTWEEGHGNGQVKADVTGHAPINPAAMTRQLDAMLARETDMRVRLTSLNPLNPANAPDAWERAALMEFERGVKEKVEHFDGAGRHGYRYMAPLKTLETCLPCHAGQGYKTGDVRGALSIHQDADHIMRYIAAQTENLKYLHIAAFLLLASVTWLSLSIIRRHIQTIETERDRRRRMADDLALKVEELKRTQHELVQSEKQASLGRMVAGFAHEVNTPVGVAVGATSHAQDALREIERLLGDEEVSEEDLRRQLGIIGESADLALANLRRAATLVQSFKRTSVDQISDQDRDYDMAEVIDDVRRSLHNIFKRTRISVHTDCPEDLRLHGPVGAVEQILTNLFMNSYYHAFDEGNRPGNVRLHARRDSDGNIRLDYEDDGAGMSAETLEKLFEPFHTTRRGKGGSGLGLYIVHSLATLNLGGTISCDSEPGRGTRFTLVFPMHHVSKQGNGT
jgi:signal transduction histidine kinase